MKKIFILTTICVLFVAPFVLGDFLGFWDKITGMATSSDTNVTISLSNVAPVITKVNFTTEVGPTESSYTQVNVWFIAQDADGAINLDDTTAELRFNNSGVTRFNTSCTNAGDIDAFNRNYSCSVRMWYFDTYDDWDINASIQDLNNAPGENSTESFLFQELTAFVMAPKQVTWAAGITTVTKNQTAQNALVLNNTGNDPDLSGAAHIQINATDLVGGVTGDRIPAANFSASIFSGANACNASRVELVNVTFTGITNAVLPVGNNSAGAGQESLYICLEEVPAALLSDTYSTGNGGAGREWVVQILG